MSEKCPDCRMDHESLASEHSHERLFIHLVLKAIEMNAAFKQGVKAGLVPEVTVEESLAIVFAHIGRLVHANTPDAKFPLRWLINKCLDKCERNVDKIKTAVSMN